MGSGDRAGWARPDAASPGRLAAHEPLRARILDAGLWHCAAAIELARRGAEVVAVDLSPTLVQVAKERAAESSIRGRIDFRSGDMLDPSFGRFDHVIAMDSLIHYERDDALTALGALADRVEHSIVWTFAPRPPC